MTRDKPARTPPPAVKPRPRPDLPAGQDKKSLGLPPVRLPAKPAKVPAGARKDFLAAGASDADVDAFIARVEG